MMRVFDPKVFSGPTVVVTCTLCGGSWAYERADALRLVGAYSRLDLALGILSGRCGGQGVAPCDVRFTGVAGAESARSILVRRGEGWRRRSSRANGKDFWSISFNGWSVGGVYRIPHGPSAGLWHWGSLTHRPRAGTTKTLQAALKQIKPAVVIQSDGLPNVEAAWTLRGRIEP